MSNKAATSSSSSMRTEEDMIEDHPPISCAPSGTELKKGNTFFISAADKHTHTHTRAHTLIPDTPRKVDSFITAHMKQSHSSTSTHTHTHRQKPRGVLSVIFTVHINHCCVKIFTNSVTLNLLTPRKTRCRSKRLHSTERYY